MKGLFLVGLIVLGIAGAAIAGTMTWSKPLPSAQDATLGQGQLLEKQKTVNEEMRARIAAMGVFAGYTTQGN